MEVVVGVVCCVFLYDEEVLVIDLWIFFDGVVVEGFWGLVCCVFVLVFVQVVFFVRVY